MTRQEVSDACIVLAVCKNKEQKSGKHKSTKVIYTLILQTIVNYPVVPRIRLVCKLAPVP